MKNRINIFSLLVVTGLLVIACNDSAKQEKAENSDKQEIRKTLDAYNSHLMKGEYAAMTDYIYPGLFEDFSKEEIIAGQEQSMHSELFDVSIKSITIDSISEVYAYGADKYALAIHKARNSFQFKDDATPEILDAYCMNFKNSLGDDNVKCDIAGRNFDITMQDLAFFIYSGKQKKWFTLGTTNPEDINKHIPAEVRKQLGLEEN